MFGPGFAYSPDEKGSWFGRSGDVLRVAVNMHGDQNADIDGTYVNDQGVAEGTTQLLRDGVVIYDNPASPGTIVTVLPPEEATYTARTTATKAGPLSTRIDAEWTFRSGRVENPEVEGRPALAVRFAPNLDNQNAAPAGKKFRFPAYVQRNGAEQPGQVNTPAVEISYDDGATWQKVRLSRHHGQWLAEVNHPAGAQFASLRYSVSDNDGNSAKATIIHAYALK